MPTPQDLFKLEEGGQDAHPTRLMKAGYLVSGIEKLIFIPQSVGCIRRNPKIWENTKNVFPS
jgi:hypothetical protein